MSDLEQKLVMSRATHLRRRTYPKWSITPITPRERERHRERQTDRQTDRQRQSEIDTDRQTDRDRVR